MPRPCTGGRLLLASQLLLLLLSRFSLYWSMGALALFADQHYTHLMQSSLWQGWSRKVLYGFCSLIGVTITPMCIARVRMSLFVALGYIEHVGM